MENGAKGGNELKKHTVNSVLFKKKRLMMSTEPKKINFLNRKEIKIAEGRKK